MQRGYGVLVNGEIDLRTVSETERAAKVNGLLVIYQRMTMRDATDDEIESVWGGREFFSCTNAKTEVVPVHVTVATN